MERKKSDLDIKLEAIAQMLEGGFSFRTALEYVERIKEASPELGEPIVPNLSQEERSTIREEIEKKVSGEIRVSRRSKSKMEEEKYYGKLLALQVDTEILTDDYEIQHVVEALNVSCSWIEFPPRENLDLREPSSE